MSHTSCIFDRSAYLAFSELFEAGDIDNSDAELSEFNFDREDLAYELSYSRYHIAKTERQRDTYRDLCGELLKALIIANEMVEGEWSEPAPGALEAITRAESVMGENSNEENT